MDQIFRHLDVTQRKTISSILIAEAIKKRDIFFIDSAFVLRVFLEYYRKERNLRFLIIERFFKIHPQAVVVD